MLVKFKEDGQGEQTCNQCNMRTPRLRKKKLSDNCNGIYNYESKHWVIKKQQTQNVSVALDKDDWCKHELPGREKINDCTHQQSGAALIEEKLRETVQHGLDIFKERSIIALVVQDDLVCLSETK